MGVDGMRGNNQHIPDEDLILAAEGEAPRRRAAKTRAHLAGCAACQARMEQLEAAMAGFTRAHHERFSPHLSNSSGARALLSARLDAIRSDSPRFRPTLRTWGTPAAALACALLCAGLFFTARNVRRGAELADAGPAPGAIPNRALTPGATRPVSIADVCSMPHEEVVKEVPDDLRQRVFAEYGVPNARAADYEVDYLIAPGLGGTDDLHNLWPEPYTSPTWNARVKDDLEERLHQMVCARQLDLGTAQREIATDWITAYKKYFHTQTPGALHTDLALPERMVALAVPADELPAK
jgi:anti-sigma factor RsiW